MEVIKVSGTSRTSAVAGAIAGVFREFRRAEVQAIGAGAVNQAVKALILARSYLNEDGYHIAFVPTFTDVQIEDKIRTAIKFIVVECETEASVEAQSLEEARATEAAEDAAEEN